MNCHWFCSFCSFYQFYLSNAAELVNHDSNQPFVVGGRFSSCFPTARSKSLHEGWKIWIVSIFGAIWRTSVDAYLLHGDSIFSRKMDNSYSFSCSASWKMENGKLENVYPLDGSLGTLTASLPIRKGHPLLGHLSSAMLRILHDGILNQILEKYGVVAKKKSQNKQLDPLAIEDVNGLIVLIKLGLAVAWAVWKRLFQQGRIHNIS